MRILVVDDSAVSLLLLERILNKAGYNDLRIVKSAEGAFHELGMNAPDISSFSSTVDLVLMDVVMHGMDGIEATRCIKAMKPLCDLPIIMVTGSTGTESLQKAFDAGAIDYVTKPVNKVELLARVRSALRLKQEMDRRKEREEELLTVTRQLEGANKVLQRLSFVDGLTGVANRRYFDDALKKEWRRANRLNKPLSLIMVDIDFFKRFNDTYGHQAGDDCLKAVASVLSVCFRRAGDLVARYGGEEFTVIMPVTELKDAEMLAEKAREKIELLKIRHDRSETSEYVTISLGVASIIPDCKASEVDIVAAADGALYQAKHEGRNRAKAATLVTNTKSHAG